MVFLRRRRETALLRPYLRIADGNTSGHGASHRDRPAPMRTPPASWAFLRKSRMTIGGPLSPTQAHPASCMRWPLGGKAAAAVIFRSVRLDWGQLAAHNRHNWHGAPFRRTVAPERGPNSLDGWALQGAPAQVLRLGDPPGSGLAPGERHGRGRNHRSDDIASHHAPPRIQ
jgi:hypothetical protein